MQWDKRWGYMEYGSDVAALTACGPVCLSMAAVYVRQDIKYSPDYVIEFAIDNGYCLKKGGSEWALISEGGEKLGMDVTEIPLDKNRVFKNLEAGNPIICVMGPGDFTTKGKKRQKLQEFDIPAIFYICYCKPVCRGRHTLR